LEVPVTEADNCTDWPGFRKVEAGVTRTPTLLAVGVVGAGVGDVGAGDGVVVGLETTPERVTMLT
jgi:hypothetical protein